MSRPMKYQNLMKKILSKYTKLLLIKSGIKMIRFVPLAKRLRGVESGTKGAIFGLCFVGPIESGKRKSVKQLVKLCLETGIA